MKKIIFIIIIVILSTGASSWFYQDYKKTQKIMVKAENKLTEDGFEKFYQKQGNKFCIKKENKKEQEAIAQDMLWILENGDYREVKTIECEDGGMGIEVK